MRELLLLVPVLGPASLVSLVLCELLSQPVSVSSILLPTVSEVPWVLLVLVGMV